MPVKKIGIALVMILGVASPLVDILLYSSEAICFVKKIELGIF